MRSKTFRFRAQSAWLRQIHNRDDCMIEKVGILLNAPSY